VGRDKAPGEPEDAGPDVAPREARDAGADADPGEAQDAGPDAAPGAGPDVAVAKAALRRRLLAARAGLTAEQRAAAGRSLRDTILSLPQVQMAGTIAAYYSLGSEPDTRGLVYALWKRGSYVLLPILRPDMDLDWAAYEGPDSLRAGLRGLTEPAESPRGTEAVRLADAVIVPALAVDRRGVRLGRGGGSYDRALARVGPQVPTIALLYEGELLDEVPATAHDQRVRLAACPATGITGLPYELPSSSRRP
jgi:5-formyltetrahydrofolate cyclo-ligase